MKKFLFFIYFFSTCLALHAQDYFLPINREWNLRYEPNVNSFDSKVHTSVKPYRTADVHTVVNLDSANSIELKDCKFNKTLLGRKLRKENLFVVKDDDFIIYVNPLFDFTGGRETKQPRTVFTNTRGIWISGTVGERFSFSTTFNENQAQEPNYLDAFTRNYKIIPGDGRVKNLYSNFDYENVTGTISYSLKKYFNFQFGHDKNFIGDGYRSLLLSDNANSYPFLKISTTVWKIKYVNLFALMEDLQIPAPNDTRFKRKYGSFHYLDFNIGKRTSVGLLEAVIWGSDTIRGRGFDLNYVNPFVFVRPLEYSIGSPDNMMIGVNFKFKITPKIISYGQLMLDEFKINEVRSGKGWWGNKQAFQLGVKTTNLFLKNLDLLTEFNYVRPFTYSHRSTLTNYAHFNQSLAHPLGSDFYESVSILNYSYKNFYLRTELMYAIAGSDTGKTNLGNDIFKNYNTRTFEYGNKIIQGMKNTLIFGDIRIGYLINPVTNLVAEAGITYRKNSNKYGDSLTNLFVFGIRTNLFNHYHDF